MIEFALTPEFICSLFVCYSCKNQHHNCHQFCIEKPKRDPLILRTETDNKTDFNVYQDQSYLDEVEGSQAHALSGK